MQQELEWIKKWYEKSTTPILLFSSEWNILWQNMPCPMLDSVKDYPAFFALKDNVVSKTEYQLLEYHGALYQVQLDHHQLNETPFFTVMVTDVSLQEVSWKNEIWREQLFCESAALRQQLFGIGNALSVLNDITEDVGIAYSHTILEEQEEQMNIIRGNCCRLMRQPVFFSEINKYYGDKELQKEVLSLSEVLENFIESLTNVLGRSHQFQLSSDQEHKVSVNGNRLYFFLFCIFLSIKEAAPDCMCFSFGTIHQNHQIQLTICAEPNGSHLAGNRHATFTPRSPRVLSSPIEQILTLFCKEYHVTLLKTQSEDQFHLALCFPETSEDSEYPHLSGTKTKPDCLYPLEEVLTSFLTDYQYF